MANPSNLAYDYKRFEERSTPQISKVKHQPRQKKQFLLVKAVCCMTIVVLMLSALLYTKVVQSELNMEYNAAVKELSTLKGENSRLQIKIEKEFSDDSIERIARDALQMQELDYSKIEYIQINNHDKAKVIAKQTFFDTIWGWLSRLFG